MPLNPTQIANLSKVAITHYVKNPPTDQINVERPLLDVLLPKAKNIDGGLDGFAINIFKSNDANGQLYSGNGKVTYNSRNPNEIAKYDWMNHHDGFVISEEELKRAGIAVTDDEGKNMGTAAEGIAIANLSTSLFKALDEGVKDMVHSVLWLDGSQYSNALPGVDAMVSTTPAVGTVGNISASANPYWQNIARTGLATTMTALLDALEQSKRDIQRRKGRFTHIFCGSAFYDALRNAVIGANVTQVTYGSGSKLSIDMATDTLKFDGIPLTYVPDFDTNFGFSAPAIPWTKRCYMLNLSNENQGLGLRKDSNDFMKMRYPGRPIDQYTYHFAMTSRFGLGMGKRNTHAVLSLA